MATTLQTVRRSFRLVAKATAAATDPTPVVKETASEAEGARNKNRTKTPPKAKNKAAATKKTEIKNNAKSGAKKAGVKTITTSTTGRKTTTKPKPKTTIKTAAKPTATASKKRKAEAEDDNDKVGDGATPKKRSRTTKKPAKAEDHDMKQADSTTETDPSMQGKKTRVTRKRVSVQKATEDDVNEGSGQGDTAPKPKRAQTKSTKAKGKMVNNAVAVAYQPPPVINPSDPCQVLPTELWHQILSLLPLSKVAGLSMVSKTWLDGTRTYPAWKSICEALNLGEPKLKYRSYMAMVCVRSFFICDKCHSSSNGRGRASEIPLPVANKDDHDFVWMLCHACRLEYYGRYPENVREAQVEHDWQMKRITKTSAQATYHLNDEDLYGLYFHERRNPHYRNAYPMKLYDRDEVQERALQVHAGWVGVDAFTNGIAKKRSAAFKAREDGFKTRVLKKPQKDKDVQQQQLVEGQEQPSSQSNTDGQTQVQASSEDQQRQGGIWQTLPQAQVLLLPVVEKARMVADDSGKQYQSQAPLQEPVKVMA
ncbi:hypothetical protein BGX34_006521 [Mortierella sp. NVP85]|nr:hypothetical protein BGX34_006521 [Mortierella sp. NVP85]